MTFFEALFYLIVLFSVLALAWIVFVSVTGKRRAGMAMLRIYLVIAGLYAAALVTITLATPVKVLVIGDEQYAGDWSITAASLRRTPHDPDEDYEVDFQLSNHGSHTVNGQKGLIVYLLTGDGTRYDPAPEPSTPRFDAPVKAGKWIITTRRFVLPVNENHVELVIARQGFRPGWFIIGRTPFDGHSVFHLQ